MIYTKGILLKGLLGLGAAAGATYGGWTQRDKIAGWFSSGEETKPAEAITDDLPGKVGLECQGLDTATATTGVDCSKKADSENIKVKKGDVTFEVSSLPASGSGKIKVYKDEGQGEDAYNQGLKFVIEDGDISASSGDKKLEEFETYEIKQDGADWKLTLKKKSSEEKRRILGLDSCTFPEGAAGQSTSCELTTEKISKIKFDGKTDAAVEGSGNLQITIAPSNSADFPLGFKFTLTSTSGNITIPRSTEQGNIVVKNNEGTDFRIKKVGKNLTLEEALTKDALTAKVGLQCQGEPSTTGIDCTKVDGSNIKVKQGNSTNFNVTTAPTGDSKIKLYKDDGYDNGLKFVIEGGNISGENTNKLEEFETYEIKKDGTDWKLTRKKKSWEEKRRILGLPDSCTFPETGSSSQPCTIGSEDIKKIKFDGKDETASVTGNGTLNIAVASSDEATDFPLGYKFTLTPTGGSLTINRTGNAGAITIAEGKSKEFKIKQETNNRKNLTLEEAWTLTTLPGKVGLSCAGTLSGTNGVDCTKTGSTNIKVKKNGSADFEVSTIPSSGKIKVYKTSAGEDHNEGFKFVIEGGDISESGSGSNKLEQFETYEIKKESDGWKLNRKTEAKDGIKKALGLDECTFPTGDSACDVSGAKFKKIKFSAGDTNRKDGPTNAKLKITTEEDKATYPFGYKFVLDSTTDATISSSLSIKGNTNTEFKIKKSEGTNTITLEKAWTVKTLADKVGLTCPEDNAENKECTLQDSKVNLKIEEGKKYTGLSKKSNGNGGEKKVKFELDKEGYNQGFRFYTEEAEGITLQNGSSDSDEDKKIENGSNSYQILKDSTDNNWYLTKKN